MTRAAGPAALALLWACAPRPAAADPQACAPNTASLEAGARATSLEGEYRVRLVATSGPRNAGTSDGNLRLSRAASSGGTTRTRHVLVGTSDVRVEDVGGPDLDATSKDPVRPGVVGFDLPPLPESAAPRIMLRLGAEANRQDVTRVEGPYTVLRLREIRPDGFSGDWTSGAPLPVAEGYFCAWRNAPEER